MSKQRIFFLEHLCNQVIDTQLSRSIYPTSPIQSLLIPLTYLNSGILKCKLMSNICKAPHSKAFLVHRRFSPAQEVEPRLPELLRWVLTKVRSELNMWYLLEWSLEGKPRGSTILVSGDLGSACLDFAAPVLATVRVECLAWIM